MSSTRPHLRLPLASLVALVTVACVPGAIADVRPPQLTLTGHPRATVRGTSATIAFRIGGQHVSVRCRLDAGRSHPCRSPVRMPNLAPGSHRLELRATNRDGRVLVTVRWTVVPDLVPAIESSVPVEPPVFPEVVGAPIVTPSLPDPG